MTAVEKERIINIAQRVFEKVKESSISDTQIRKYLDVLKDPDLEIFEEYKIYIEYQLVRSIKSGKNQKQQEQAKKDKKAKDAIMNALKEELPKGDRWKENLAYFFGILWRLRRIESKKGSGGENK